MRKEYRKSIKRTFYKGVKKTFVIALSSSVVLWSPWAVCHVSAARPVRFSTYLMLDSNGEIATDADGKYIQLFDEKGNILSYNDDVREFVTSHSEDEESAGLSAMEQEFFLIDGKLYRDEAKTQELGNLTEVMPAIFKYGTINEGYTLQSDNGTVYISPLEVNGDSVYVARIAGDDSNLPAFTLNQSGQIGYLESGAIGSDDHQVSFVYDENYLYDENMNVIEDMSGAVPNSGDEASPMFTGYYADNGEGRKQVVDIDGSITISIPEFKELFDSGVAVEEEYCNKLVLSANDAESLTVYSDIEDGSLYKDYRKTEAFDNVGGAILSQLAYNEDNDSRGHFAGYYYSGEGDEIPTVRFIDDSGNLISDVGALGGNAEYFARFYHTVSFDGTEVEEGQQGPAIYYSDGSFYSDAALTTQIDNIADVIGGIPEDQRNDVHSDEKDMDGVETRYFIGYYFSTDFGHEDDEEADREILLSEYDKEGFDPAEVEIDKVKLAGRDGSLVFDIENSPAIDGDMQVYQNWYTVTVWDDNEVEIRDDAEEITEEEEAPVEEEGTEETAEGTEDTEGTEGSEENTEGTTEENTEGTSEENTEGTTEDNAEGTQEDASENAGEETQNSGEGNSSEEGSAEQNPSEESATEENAGSEEANTENNEGAAEGSSEGSEENSGSTEGAQPSEENTEENSDDSSDDEHNDEIREDAAPKEDAIVEENPAPRDDGNGGDGGDDGGNSESSNSLEGSSLDADLPKEENEG